MQAGDALGRLVQDGAPLQRKRYKVHYKDCKLTGAALAQSESCNFSRASGVIARRPGMALWALTEAHYDSVGPPEVIEKLQDLLCASAAPVFGCKTWVTPQE